MNYLDIPSPDERALSRAVAAFSDAVGSEHVITSDNKLAEYRDPFSFDGGNAHRPGAVVQPGTVEEVQAVVRIANEQKIPLWVVSTGRNLGYGGAAPRVSGSVTVELARLNRVLEVNDEQCYALVEPGVRFFDLYQYVRDHDKKVWCSVPGLGWGSVIGNSLERGFGYTAYGDHSAQQCGMEVVLPTGELFRTGMGAITNANTWNLYKGGFGPNLEGLFQQSNLGIVTKMGLWMMPRPEVFYSVEARVKEEKTLVALVDAIRPLKLDGTIEGTLTIRSPLHIVSKLAQRKDLWKGAGAVPDEVIDKEIIPRFDVAWWNVNFGLYGARELVEARLAIARRALEALPGTEVTVRKYEGAEVAEDTIHVTDLHRGGIPNLTPFSAVKWRGENGGTIAFAPVSPITGRDAMKQVEVVRRYGRQYGFDYYGSFNMGPRSMNHVYQIFFDRDSEADMANLREMLPKMIAECESLGYSEYRAHVGLMDTVADVFSFNDNALGTVTARLKDALDPNGVLNPGKQGIWPRAMRTTARPQIAAE